MAARPAIFLDRDGTIIEDAHYLSRIEQVKLFPEAAAAIRLFNHDGWPVVLVTNQSGVGRGFFSEESIHVVHAHLKFLLAEQGARLDAIYYCPHHPDAGCDCRKPRPGMLLRAAAEHNLDLSRSWMLGDKDDDVGAGVAVKCRTMKIENGLNHQNAEAILNEVHEARP